MTDPRPHRATRPRAAAIVTTVAFAVLLGAGSPAAGQVGGPIRPDDDPAPTTTEPSPTTDAPAEEPAPAAGGGDDDGGSPDTTGPVSEDREADDDVARDDDTERVAASSADDGGVSVLGLIALLGAGFLLGAALVGGPLWIALARRRSQQAPVAVAPPPPAPVPPPGRAPGTVVVPSARELEELRDQRDGLVQALIRLRDRLPSEALADEAGAALVAAGVEEVRPDGVPFDPSRHRAVGRVDGAGSAGDGDRAQVAGVERPGYRDGERTLRLPDVLVSSPEDGG